MATQPFWYFKTECPRCGNKSEVGNDRPQTPTVKCGNCLMDRIEFVDLICTPVEDRR